jgi:hypothetical protein
MDSTDRGFCDSAKTENLYRNLQFADEIGDAKIEGLVKKMKNHNQVMRLWIVF